MVELGVTAAAPSAPALRRTPGPRWFRRNHDDELRRTDKFAAGQASGGARNKGARGVTSVQIPSIAS
jgi:hypothetical protein